MIDILYYQVSIETSICDKSIWCNDSHSVHWCSCVGIRPYDRIVSLTAQASIHKELWHTCQAKKSAMDVLNASRFDSCSQHWYLTRVKKKSKECGVLMLSQLPDFSVRIRLWLHSWELCRNNTPPLSGLCHTRWRACMRLILTKTIGINQNTTKHSELTTPGNTAIPESCLRHWPKPEHHLERINARLSRHMRSQKYSWKSIATSGDISDIRLRRTDTTLDLSQKAEKVWRRKLFGKEAWLK